MENLFPLLQQLLSFSCPIDAFHLVNCDKYTIATVYYSRIVERNKNTYLRLIVKCEDFEGKILSNRHRLK